MSSALFADSTSLGSLGKRHEQATVELWIRQEGEASRKLAGCFGSSLWKFLKDDKGCECNGRNQFQWFNQKPLGIDVSLRSFELFALDQLFLEVVMLIILHDFTTHVHGILSSVHALGSNLLL